VKKKAREVAQLTVLMQEISKRRKKQLLLDPPLKESAEKTKRSEEGGVILESSDWQTTEDLLFEKSRQIIQQFAACHADVTCFCHFRKSVKKFTEGPLF
jgi:hypothetical protein